MPIRELATESNSPDRSGVSRRDLLASVALIRSARCRSQHALISRKTSTTGSTEGGIEEQAK
jgi:hypothetical protein